MPSHPSATCVSSPFRVRGLCLAMAAAGLATSLPALAQSSDAPNATPAAAASAPAAPAGSADAAALEKVVITSNKRAGTQREVAGTVSVLDGTDLERRGARDQEDTLKLAPGVQFNKGDVGSNTITIRGIGTSTTNEGSGAQQGPTGSYLEDVPLSSATGKGIVADPLTWDLDRVEVLRGPQGVLFGSGSLGGAVRYLYNKPRMNALEASVKGDYAKASGGDGKFSLYGMLNAPLVTDTLALRVVAFDRRDPGYIDNLGTGTKDANDLHQTGGRVLLTARASADLVATLALSTQKTEQGDTFSVSPDPDKLEHTAPNNSTRSVRGDFYSLTVDWNLGAHTLTSITGYWKNRTQTLIDDTELFASVGLPLPEVIRPSSGTSSATSQEFRLASNPGGALGYVVGMFYQRQKGDSAAKQIDPSGAFGLTDLVDLTSTAGGTEKAIFGDAEYQFGNGWSAGAGGRFYWTTTESQQHGTVFGAPADVVTPDGKDDGFTPKLTVKYRFDANNLWYALASKGYRYGGVNGSAPYKPFKSDSLWNYETGLRLAPSSDLQLDLTAFLQDWKDAQFTYFTMNGPLPESGIDNVGKARSIGLEAAMRWRLNAMFDFGASLAWINAETKVDTLVPVGAGSMVAPAGSRLPGTPKFQAALQGNARFEGPFESSGLANATYTYVGDRVMYLGGNKPADAYGTLDLGLSFFREAWTVAAGLANATDERGVMSITGAPAGVGSFAQYFVQRPRTLTVSLRYDY